MGHEEEQTWTLDVFSRESEQSAESPRHETFDVRGRANPDLDGKEPSLYLGAGASEGSPIVLLGFEIDSAGQVGRSVLALVPEKGSFAELAQFVLRCQLF